MHKGVLPSLSLHLTASFGQQGPHWNQGLWPSLQTCSEAVLRGQQLNDVYFSAFLQSSAVPLCCWALQSNFSSWSFCKCLCAGKDPVKTCPVLPYSEPPGKFLYIGLATRKLCGVFCVKCSCSGVSHTQQFCSPSKFTIAGRMAKWWVSLPVVKPQHRLPKQGWCCFLSRLHWFVKPYSSESVILFLFLTLPLR